MGQKEIKILIIYNRLKWAINRKLTVTLRRLIAIKYLNRLTALLKIDYTLEQQP